MRYLLDTHAFLWWANQPRRLSAELLQTLTKAETVWLSVISVWELQIKIQVGKLDLQTPLAQLVQEQTTHNQIQLLPVQLAHIFALQELPLHHRDPFDRLLIAQAQREKAIMITADQNFAHYAVDTLW